MDYLISRLILSAFSDSVPWTSSTTMQHKAYKEVFDVYPNILSKLAFFLNSYHNTKHNDRYWSLLIGPWLLSVLTVIYDRHQLYIASFHSNSHNGTSLDSPLVIPRNIYEASKLFEDPTFNDQLLLLIHNTLTLNGSNRPPSLRVSSLADQNKQGVLRQFKRYLINFISKITSNSQSLKISILAIPLSRQIKLFKSIPNIRPIYPIPDSVKNYPHSLNLTQRYKLLSTSPGQTEFEELIRIILPKVLPVSLLEGYATTIRRSAIYGKLPPSSVLTSCEMYGRYESYIHWYAYAASSCGTSLASMQHGGIYGMEYTSETVHIEISPFDFFFSWGWHWYQYGLPEYRRKVIPMPAFHLEKHVRHRPESSGQIRILYVTTSLRQFFRRAEPSFMIPYYADRYFSMQSDFYSGLSSSVRDNFYVRLFKHDWNRQSRSRWINNFPDVKFDSFDSFDQSLYASSLCICDHLSTTWIEAITANIPTVVLVDSPIYQFTPEFSSLLDLLNSVGIVQTSPSLAADFVEANHSSINKWWNSESVQNALDILRSNYILTIDNTFTQRWVQALRTLLS